MPTVELATKVMNELSRHRSAWPFHRPVDRARYPDYYKKINKPMDLHTVKKNLQAGLYTTADGVRNVDAQKLKQDVELIWSNCFEYYSNDPSCDVCRMARAMQGFFLESTHKHDLNQVGASIPTERVDSSTQTERVDTSTQTDREDDL